MINGGRRIQIPPISIDRDTTTAVYQRKHKDIKQILGFGDAQASGLTSSYEH